MSRVIIVLAACCAVTSIAAAITTCGTVICLAMLMKEQDHRYSFAGRNREKEPEHHTQAKNDIYG